MVKSAAIKVDGILFDKDGTLFDFHATWSVWAAAMLERLAGGCTPTHARLAEAIHFDTAQNRFLPTSPVIAGTNREVAEALARALPGRDVAEIAALLEDGAAQAPVTPAAPLPELFAGLAARGLTLGVMTNDSAAGARAHLHAAGVADRLAFIAGADSGFGAKPDPGPLLAFARHAGLAPARVVMVGDSTHDLIAGRAAGMRTVAVLTGLATLARPGSGNPSARGSGMSAPRGPGYGIALAGIGTLVLTPDSLFMRFSGMDGVQMTAWRGLFMGGVMILAWLIVSRGRGADLRLALSGPGLVVIGCQFFNSLLFCLGIAAAPVAYDLACDIAELAAWMRGYGETRQRGRQRLGEALDAVSSRLDSDRAGLAGSVRTALADAHSDQEREVTP